MTFCIKSRIGRKLLALFIVAICAAGCSKDRDWSDLRKESVRLFVKRDLDGAMEIEKRAMAIAEKSSPNDPRLIKSLRFLATIHRLKGRTAEAVPLYKRAISIADIAQDNSEIDNSVRDLTTAYVELGLLADAEPLMKRSILISESKHGKKHPSVAKDLINLAMLYKSMGREKDSRDYAARAAAIPTQTR
jgi:tetratricopeptide (TPR) repeat protein